MSTSDKARKAEKAKNYTAEQVAVIRAAEPLDLAKAKAVGAEIGKSYQSIIAKCLSEGIAYESKKPEPKRVNQVTKADMVKTISARLDNANLKGLEKATAISLKRLYKAVAVSLAFTEPEAESDNG